MQSNLNTSIPISAVIRWSSATTIRDGIAESDCSSRNGKRIIQELDGIVSNADAGTHIVNAKRIANLSNDVANTTVDCSNNGVR